MQQIDYSLINKRPVVRVRQMPERVGKSCFMDENRHNRFSADPDVNNKINALIKEASEQLSKEIK